MASPAETEGYRRLPGRSRRLFTLIDAERQQLWLGEEHILNLRIAWATERHQRFHLRDIQAITVTGTDRGRNLNYVLGIVTAILGGIGLYFFVGALGSSVAIPLGLISGAGAAFFAAFFLVNLALGRTCVCRLYTAVQTVELRSLGRARPARRFVEIVTPLIEAAQGAVTEEMLQERELESLQASRHARQKRQILSEEALNHSEGGAHMALFTLLLLSGLDVFTMAAFSFPSRRIFDFGLFLLTIVMNIVALIRQKKTDLPGPVRGISWTSIIVMGFLVFVIATAASTFSILQGAGFTETVSLELPGGTWFVVLTAIVGTAMTLLGGLGMLDLIRFRRAYRRLTASGPLADEAAEGMDD